MRKHITRAIAAFTAIALGAVALQFSGAPAIAGADTTVSIQCDGISGDNAGSLSGAPKSSKELVALLVAGLLLVVAWAERLRSGRAVP